MTTVAYRDGIVAADSRMVSNGWKFPYPAQKLFRMKDGTVCAVTGGYVTAVRLVHWLDTDRSEARPDLGDEARVLHFRGDGLVDVHEGGACFPLRPDFAAWGSGSPAANAAMYVGADARMAVEAAAFVDDSTGGEIVTMRVEE